MQEIAAAERGRPAATAVGWVNWLRPYLGERYLDRNGRERSERSRATSVGSLFRDDLDATFDIDGAA